MEDYVAADQRPVDKCLADVTSVDIYVGIFAFRYGYVPPDSHGNPKKLSITELEFRQAESLAKPCLTFVVNESTAWRASFMDSQKAEDKGERINSFRQHLLTEKMASSFSTPHELSTLVLAAITKQQAAKTKVHEATKQDEALKQAATWNIEKDGSPYPGLMHFTRKYARVFFGREAEVNEILDRMRGPEGRFIIISGDSGVGKSSVVDAGISPKLEDGALPGDEACMCVRMVPGQGSQPFAALVIALGGYATRAGLRPETVTEDLKRSPETFTEQIRKIVSDGTDGNQLVLFVDQMEELFTAQDVEESNKFLTALYRATQEKALWVLATIRSDHLHFCHRHPEMLSVLKGSGHYPLGRVEPYMMVDMIKKPAESAGLKVLDSFARRIVNDTLAFRSLDSAESDSANLPLMAFVLNQLFLKRSNHSLSEGVYNSMGGLSGAIVEHVKSVELKLPQHAGAKTADHLGKIFHSLVNVKDEGPPTRNRPVLNDFSTDLHPSVKLLVDERLLRTESEGAASTVSISHEKLFEAWPALRDYISTNKKALIDQTLLNSRARKWLEMGQPWFSGLTTGRELKDFRRAGVMSAQVNAYLRASKRAWGIKWLTGIGFFVVFLAVVLAWQQGLSLDHIRLRLKSTFAQIHIEPEMVEVKGGMFKMGNVGGNGKNNEHPVRDVQVKRFAIGKYEITFEEYDRFALAKGKPLPFDQGWGRGRQPAINVSWEDARDFAKWLADMTGKKYRLPSEAEWEYAARSGGKEEIWAGTSNEPELDDFAWSAKNSGNRSRRVGTTKLANGLELHDMSGNVWEWVEDCWHDSYNGAPSDARAWGKDNGEQCGQHVLHGGSWGDPPVNLRSSFRGVNSADFKGNFIGFRLAQDLE